MFIFLTFCAHLRHILKFNCNIIFLDLYLFNVYSGGFATTKLYFELWEINSLYHYMALGKYDSSDGLPANGFWDQFYFVFVIMNLTCFLSLPILYSFLWWYQKFYFGLIAKIKGSKIIFLEKPCLDFYFTIIKLVYNNPINHSIKAPVCQWVSESVCLTVWMFPNSYETANPSELKFWGMILLGMEKVLG